MLTPAVTGFYCSHLAIPDLQRAVVILDQNALSALCAPHNEQWTEIRRIVLDGVESGKLMCPIMQENVIETYKIPNEKERNETLSLMKKLSCGYQTRVLGEIIAREILSQVRPFTEAEAIVQADLTAILEDSTDTLHANVRLAEIATNRAMPCAPSQYPGGLDSLRVAHTDHQLLLEAIAESLRELKFNPLQNVSSFSDKIVARLLQLGLCEEERLRLISLLNEGNKPASIALYAYCLICNQHRMDRKRVDSVNSLCDIFRTAVAMCCADLFITERYPVSALYRSKLSHVFNSVEVIGFSDTQGIAERIRRRISTSRRTDA